MTEETASVPRTQDSTPPLIFHWKRLRGVRRRLAAFLLVAAAAHAALFYLFRVIPAVSNQKPPKQHAVVYLPPQEPGVRSMLSALSDRYPGAVLRSEDYSFQADVAALSDLTPEPPPVWAGRNQKLKPFTQPLAPQEMPRLMQPGEPLLPDNAPPPVALPSHDAGPAKPRLSAFAEGSTRAITTPAQWPDNPVDETTPGGSVTFMAAIDRFGRPRHCMALTSTAGVDLEQLRRGLMDMRWEENPQVPLEWITLQVRW